MLILASGISTSVCRRHNRSLRPHWLKDVLPNGLDPETCGMLTCERSHCATMIHMFDIFGTGEWRHGCGFDRYSFEEVVIMNSPRRQSSSSLLHVQHQHYTSLSNNASYTNFWEYSGVRCQHTSCHRFIRTGLAAWLFLQFFSMESCFRCLWIHSCIFACEDVHVHSPVAHMRHCSPTSPYIVDTTACIKEGVSWYRATRSLPLRCINVMYKKDSCLVWVYMLLVMTVHNTFTPTNRRFGLLPWRDHSWILIEPAMTVDKGVLVFWESCCKIFRHNVSICIIQDIVVRCHLQLRRLFVTLGNSCSTLDIDCLAGYHPWLVCYKPYGVPREQLGYRSDTVCNQFFDADGLFISW